MIPARYPWDHSDPSAGASFATAPAATGDADAAVLPPASETTSAAVIAAPHAPAAPVQQLYLVNPGDGAAIAATDIHQGQIGDCFLLSSIGEIALQDPAAIAGMIRQNADGTETVTLRVPAATRAGLTFGTAAETVTNVFPAYSVNGQRQDTVGNVAEIWPQVLEKAAAQLAGGYGGIANGGSPVVAMEVLTGHAASWTQNVAALSAATLASDWAAKDLIVMDTPNRGSLPFNLVGDHAYMFDGVQTVSGTAMAKLLNPWGFDQPALIPVAQLAKGIAEVDVGHA